MKIKKYFTPRVIILIIALIFALITISPKISTQGVLIKSVQGTLEQELGLQPEMIIFSINNNLVNNIEDYNKIINSEIKVNITTANLTNETAKQIIKFKTNRGDFSYLTSDKPQLSVSDVPSTNIKKGLEMAGGTRVLLKPVSDIEPVTDKGISDVIKVLTNRLNVYGLSDLKIRSSNDLAGTKYVLIEIAGVDRDEVKSKIAEQGKFEAKIGDEPVFEGGKNDIPFVCRDDGSCSGIRSCDRVQDGYQCRFTFSIHLSQQAANTHAGVTKDLDVNMTESGNDILSKTIDFYLDGKLVDSLQIASDLKGKAATQVEISGPGFGKTEQLAYEDAIANMDNLQTILITGSLPYTLEIIKLDYISPILGQAFVKNILWTMLAAMLAVSIVIYARYRVLKIIIPIIITMLSEIFITLGIAALINWNLDIASIAGLIAVVGTGVNDQIIITDEVLKGEVEFAYSWKEKIKRSFFIIFVAYFTLFAAMIPLWYAGAGLLRGFAVTTIIGLSIGVFITRPAFAGFVEQLLKKE